MVQSVPRPPFVIEAPSEIVDELRAWHIAQVNAIVDRLAPELRSSRLGDRWFDDAGDCGDTSGSRLANLCETMLRTDTDAALWLAVSPNIDDDEVDFGGYGDLIGPAKMAMFADIMAEARRRSIVPPVLAPVIQLHAANR